MLKVQRVHSSFSFRGDNAFLTNDIRVSSKLEPFGALGDLGWYCIRFGLLAFSGLQATDFESGADLGQKWRMLPRRVTATCSRWSAEASKNAYHSLPT